MRYGRRKIARWLGRGKVIPPPAPDEQHLMLQALCAHLGLNPLGKKKEEDVKPHVKPLVKSENKRKLATPWPGAKRRKLEDGDSDYELP